MNLAPHSRNFHQIPGAVPGAPSLPALLRGAGVHTVVLRAEAACTLPHRGGLGYTTLGPTSLAQSALTL